MGLMSRLSRRTPLRPGGPLARSELRPGVPPRRRTPLRPVSEQRAAERPERDEVREFVLHRDQRCRLAGWSYGGEGPPACFGQLSFHHIRKAGQGGPYTRLNGLTLCVFHNDWLETWEGHRWGVSHGVVCLNGRTLEQCWELMRAWGLVRWDHDGQA